MTSTPRVRVGEAFRFTVKLRAKHSQKLLIDYEMSFARPGPTSSKKIFKLKQVEVDADEAVSLSKVHPMRPMTTRRLYAGEHRITLQVNGRPFGSLAFDLLLD